MFFDHHTPFNAPIIFRACVTLWRNYNIYKKIKLRINKLNFPIHFLQPNTLPSFRTTSSSVKAHSLDVRNQIEATSNDNKCTRVVFV
jgi:hypothetical protein